MLLRIADGLKALSDKIKKVDAETKHKTASGDADLTKSDCKYILEILLDDFDDGGYKNERDAERYYRLKRFFNKKKDKK